MAATKLPYISRAFVRNPPNNKPHGYMFMSLKYAYNSNEENV